MKIKQYILISSIACVLISYNIKPHDNQPAVYQQEFKQNITFASEEDRLLASISFSGLGIQNYIQTVFNNTYYSKELLPNDFRHMLQFLHHGKKTGSKSYAKSVLKLFGNKIKGAHYINAYAFSHLLAYLESGLEKYVTPTPLFQPDMLKKSINDLLYSSFLAQFDQLKQNPDNFFSTLSDAVVAQLQTAFDATEQVNQQHIQQTTYRFLDICINKLIWSPQDHTAIWSNIKDIAQQLEQYCDSDLLADFDDLDDLYWSLVHRLCYFMEIAAPDLPISFYENIKQDLATNELLLVDLEEQEKHITSKGDHLMKALLAGEAKARLQQENSID